MRPALRHLALGVEGDAPLQVGEEGALVEMTMGAGDGSGAGHGTLREDYFRARSQPATRATSRAGSATSGTTR